MVPKQRLDKLIPLAMEVIDDKGTGIKKDNTISKTYHGYVSSFGAMMAISSPLAAALMFENSDKEGGDRRTKESKANVAKAILLVMRKELGNDRVPAVQEAKEDKLSKYLMNIQGGLARKHKQDLAAACIALKLAMRSYPKGE